MPTGRSMQVAARPRVDLLFTDIVMPGMNGRELADRVSERRPATRVLFTTGYTRNAVVHNGMLDAGVAFLRQALHRRPAGAQGRRGARRRGRQPAGRGGGGLAAAEPAQQQHP